MVDNQSSADSSSRTNAQDKEIGFLFLALLFLATLLLSQSVPWGTWGAAVTATLALFLAVHIASQALSSRPQVFWGGLATVAALVYVGSLAYQAGAPSRALQQQAWTSRSIAIGSSTPSLIVSYPRQAPFQASDHPGLPLFVYFDGANASPGINTSTAISFTLAFLPKREGVVFTDDKGIPVLPQIAVRTGEQSGQPAALYVRSALTSTQPVTVAVALAARPDSEGAAWQDLNTIDILTESAFHAWWRRFLGLLLGPATPILALVTTLLGFGWQWWQGEQRKRDERAAEIAQIAVALQTGVVSGALKYHEVRTKAINQHWQNDLTEQLEHHRKSILSLDWEEDLFRGTMRALVQNESNTVKTLRSAICDLSKDTEDSSFFVQAIDLAIDHSEMDTNGVQFKPKGDVVTAVKLSFQSIQRYGLVADKKYLAILKDLSQLKEAAPTILEHLECAREGGDSSLLRKPVIGEILSNWETEDDEIRSRANSLKELRKNTLSWLRPYLWHTLRPESPLKVKEWLDSQSLAFNPFGPECAQQDKELPDYVVRDVFEEAAGRRPVLVLAAPGAGRSAAAMILANDCVDPPESPREKRVFPVHCTPTVHDLIKTSERFYLRLISKATCLWLCRLVAQMPEVFLELPESRKSCLVQLQLASLGSWPLIEHTLRQANPDGKIDLVLQEMRPFSKDNVDSVCFTREAWSDLLACALPKTYECVQVLLDVPTPESKQQEVALVAGLAPLLDLVIPLSAKGIFLKLFLPNLHGLTLPPGCQTTTVTWTKQCLKDVLVGRIRTEERESKTFNQLFDLAIMGGDPAEQLVTAAETRLDAPRHLIRLGNALLRKHVELNGSDRIALSTLEAVIKDLK